MSSNAMAGHGIRGGFRWESDFAEYDNSVGDEGIEEDELIAFGPDATIDSSEGSNALERVFEPGSRTAIDLLAMIFEGSFSVTFTLENPWFLDAVFGEPSSSEDSSDPIWSHTWPDSSDDEADTPSTMRIVEAYVPTGQHRLLLGCFVTNVSISVTVEEVVEVSIEGAYADERLVEPSSTISQPSIQDRPMTFAEGSISIDGSTEGYVQDMTLTLTNNVDPVREMGERVTIDYLPKTLEPEVDFTKIHEADDDAHDNLIEMYGGTDVDSPQENVDAVDLTMVFDNGKSASDGDINRAEFEVYGTKTDSRDESGAGDPTADLEETINRFGEDVMVTWENGYESATA